MYVRCLGEGWAGLVGYVQGKDGRALLLRCLDVTWVKVLFWFNVNSLFYLHIGVHFTLRASTRCGWWWD